VVVALVLLARQWRRGPTAARASYA
jgi:hypothetical protein